MIKETNPKDSLGMTKMPLHLVSGIVKAYQAIAFYLGRTKYGAWNYRAKGATASVYKAALDRHMDKWWEGQEDDPVDGTPHLANALACISILIEAKHSGNLVDDRPPSRCDELEKLYARFETLMVNLNSKYANANPKLRHYTITSSDDVDKTEEAAIEVCYQELIGVTRHDSALDEIAKLKQTAG